MSPFEGLGKAIKLLRVERGLSQAELSEASGVGKSLMSRYESGITTPSLETLRKILGALQVGLPELTEALQRVQRHSAGEAEEKGAAARVRALQPGLPLRSTPKAYLVFDLSEGMAQGGEDGMGEALQSFRSMMRFLQRDFPAAQTRHPGSGEETSVEEPEAGKEAAS